LAFHAVWRVPEPWQRFQTRARANTGLDTPARIRQTAFVRGIETYLDLIAAHMGGDEREARQQAIALFSGLVGAMMLSRAVKNSDPTLSDELLSSARNIFKLTK
jgi:hypothetical protein